MRFEWDEGKDAANRETHGMVLDAAERFDFPSALTVRDEGRENGAVRWQSVGLLGDRLHVVVYTWRGDTVRVIPMPKANSREGALHERS